MEEENSISSERSSTSSEDSAPYSPHYSSHATSPINSQEEEESSDDHRTKHQSLKKIESAPYLTPSSSEFSPLCPPKTLLKQAFYPKDGPIFGPPFPLSASPPWMRLCASAPTHSSKTLKFLCHNWQGWPTLSTFIIELYQTLWIHIAAASLRWWVCFWIGFSFLRN